MSRAITIDRAGRIVQPAATRRRTAALLSLCAAFAAAPAFAQQPVLMSGDWAKAARETWNREATLTDQLAESGWANDDLDRGFTVIHVYRAECGTKATAEMGVALKGAKAKFVYRDAVQTAMLDDSADYVMSAETARWLEIGRGKYGPMRAMMIRPAGLRRPEDGSDGQHGPVRELSAAGRQGSARPARPARRPDARPGGGAPAGSSDLSERCESTRDEALAQCRPS